MMPLSLAAPGEENVIRKVGGNPEVRKHLQSLGLVVGSSVRLVSRVGGNVILGVKDSRLAISGEMAAKIFV